MLVLRKSYVFHFITRQIGAAKRAGVFVGLSLIMAAEI